MNLESNKCDDFVFYEFWEISLLGPHSIKCYFWKGRNKIGKIEATLYEHLIYGLKGSAISLKVSCIIKAVMGRNSTSNIEVILYEYLIFRLRGTTISM